MLELLLELLELLLELLQAWPWVHVVMNWRWLPCKIQQGGLQCPPVVHGGQWAANVHPWPLHGTNSAGQSQLVEGFVVGMLLGVLVACWPLLLLLLLLIQPMLVLLLVA